MIKSLPLGLLSSVKRIDEDPTIVEKRKNEMCVRFEKSGHPHKLISKHRSKVDKMERKELLLDKDKTKSDTRMKFVSTYSHFSDKISNVIRSQWKILGDTLHTILEFVSPLEWHKDDREI